MATKKRHAKKSKASSRSRGSKAPFAEKDFLSLKSIRNSDIEALFSLANQMKKSPERFVSRLRAKSLGLVFQKPSSRTRVAFEVGMTQL